MRKPDSAPDKSQYGPELQAHLLEQYKLVVASSERVSDRRLAAGSFLLAVNSALLAAWGAATARLDLGPWLAAIPTAGVLTSLVWWHLVESYKNLNAAKFKVIQEMENHLPAAPFQLEWEFCEQGKGKAYLPVTRLERLIPLIFLVVSILLVVLSLTHGVAPHPSVRPAPAPRA